MSASEFAPTVTGVPRRNAARILTPTSTLDSQDGGDDMANPSTTFRSPYRRRRILWALLLTTIIGFWYLATHTGMSFSSWSLPNYLKDMGLSSSSSRARLVSDAKTEAGRPRVDEMHGVLHFVTTYPDRTLNEADGAINVEGLGSIVVDPQQPVDLRVYAPDGNDTWSEHVKELQVKHPLVIFSKSYCPYVYCYAFPDYVTNLMSVA